MNYILRNLDWSYLLDIVYTVIPALICITLHEISHGYTAYLLGDTTAKSSGRLSFNPLRHIDIFGLVMMVVFKFGWAKPVPVNMRNFKNPKIGMAVTAIAGPVSNMLIAAAALFIYGSLFGALYTSDVGNVILKLIYTTAYLSTALAVFNCIPIPPLDGSKVLFSVLSDKLYFKLMRYEKYGMILLLVIVAAGALSTPLYNITQTVFGFLFNIADFAFLIFN